MTSMPVQRDTAPTLPTHGASALPAVHVDCYNLEARDGEGFVGDKASKRAFNQILDDLRDAVAKAGSDPLGSKPSEELSKKRLDALLARGAPEAGALVQSAVEEFAGRLASVLRRFLKLKSWTGTEAIVVGGGLRGSRVGEIAIARAGILLNEDLDKPVEMHLIENDPDEAGLIGATQLLPHWMIGDHDRILAVDVGGTNIRAGVVELERGKSADRVSGRVADMRLWRHGDEDGIKREDAVERLVDMLSVLIREGGTKKLAPFIGIGCPGVIRDNGTIERGAQNLPGNWESSKFNLPGALRVAIPKIGKHETVIVMHNDAVVQGLSEVPRMREFAHWAVVTIGTGLGNARFTPRA